MHLSKCTMVPMHLSKLTMVPMHLSKRTMVPMYLSKIAVVIRLNQSFSFFFHKREIRTHHMRILFGDQNRHWSVVSYLHSGVSSAFFCLFVYNKSFHWFYKLGHSFLHWNWWICWPLKVLRNYNIDFKLKFSETLGNHFFDRVSRYYTVSVYCGKVWFAGKCQTPT